MSNDVNITLPFTKSSVVIVGEALSPAMIDRTGIFGGHVDQGSLFIGGPVFHCTFQGRQYSSTVVPNRLDLRVHEADEVMPDDLVRAAFHTVDFIEQANIAAVLGSVGLNYDRIIPQSELQALRGIEHCQAAFRDGFISEVSGIEEATVWPSVVLSWWVGPIGISMRIEPERASDGNNLFVAINGNLNINEQATLRNAVSQIGEFKHAVEGIHERIN